VNYDPVDELIQISRWMREGEQRADRRVRARQLGTAFVPEAGHPAALAVKEDGLRRSA